MQYNRRRMEEQTHQADGQQDRTRISEVCIEGGGSASCLIVAQGHR